MTQPAHIVAVGVRCAVGLTAESAAAAIRAGISRVGEHPFLVNSLGGALMCAREPTIDPMVIVQERMVSLTEHALGEVLSKVTGDGRHAMQLPVLLALPEPRPGFTTRHANWVERALVSRGLAGVATNGVEVIAEGHAGALSALRTAAERVSKGLVELCVAGGVDSYFDADTIDWLEADLRVAREGVRSGFSPGEGAAVVAVASEMACRQLRLPSLARIRGIADAREQRDPKSDEGLLGEGLTEAVLQATADLRQPDETITDVYGDINGERWRSEDWGFVLLRAAERFRDGTEYVTAAGKCGDVGAATGALGCALAVQAWRRNHAKGPRALVWSGSWGGLRGAVVLERAEG
jgi:3-oxoacyl-[acyl-carrier-protein] synthase-1